MEYVFWIDLGFLSPPPTPFLPVPNGPKTPCKHFKNENQWKLPLYTNNENREDWNSNYVSFQEKEDFGKQLSFLKKRLFTKNGRLITEDIYLDELNTYHYLMSQN